MQYGPSGDEYKLKIAGMKHYTHDDTPSQVNGLNCTIEEWEVNDLQAMFDWQEWWGPPCINEFNWYGYVDHNYVIASNVVLLYSNGRYNHSVHRDQARAAIKPLLKHFS